ncbi:MAG: hypothetical protein IPQ23_11320 [Cytophagaceae bacterium]|nr:hypothetical protein [Cytophagaceae bacterium]
MKKSILTHTVIVFIFAFYAISSFGGTRKINLSGLVVDSETYRPVEMQVFLILKINWWAHQIKMAISH